jgi:hypothetical protein
MRLCKLFLALGIVALVSAPVFAQQPGGGRGGRGGANLATLVVNKSVQTELKIEGDAATKVADAIKKVNEDLKDETAKIGRGSTASDEEKAAARKKIAETQEKALKEVLSDKQMTRLQQIRHQQQGLQIFDDAEAAKTFKLTDDQKAKIKEINDGLRKEITDLNPGGGGGGRNPETLQKIATLRKDAMGNALKTLTDDQKKALKDLTGEPFEYKPDAGAGRGRGRGQPAKPRTDF